jgi:hypothetical protein
MGMAIYGCGCAQLGCALSAIRDYTRRSIVDESAYHLANLAAGEAIPAIGLVIVYGVQLNSIQQSDPCAFAKYIANTDTLYFSLIYSCIQSVRYIITFIYWKTKKISIHPQPQINEQPQTIAPIQQYNTNGQTMLN